MVLWATSGMEVNEGGSSEGASSPLLQPRLVMSEGGRNIEATRRMLIVNGNSPEERKVPVVGFGVERVRGR